MEILQFIALKCWSNGRQISEEMAGENRTYNSAYYNNNYQSKILVKFEDPTHLSTNSKNLEKQKAFPRAKTQASVPSTLSTFYLSSVYIPL